jgi:LacI family transcriptional regulator
MKMKNVIAAFTIGNIAGRNCLSGMFDFVNEGHNWKIRYMQSPDELTLEVVTKAIADKVDGIITGFRKRSDGMEALEKANIPVVFTDYPRCGTPDISQHNQLILNDDIQIGREGAKYLRSRGAFRSYAFIPTPTHTRWSTLRERGFRLQLMEAGAISSRFDPSDNLENFLSCLQKPAAIMAATDYVAMLTMEACKAANLSIPEQVAIIGVDNDELLCNSSRPTLTSIKPDHEGLGRLGAKILDCMMNGRKIPKTIPSKVMCLGVVERDSTRIVPPAGYVVRESLAFIRNNATHGITVNDVIKHIGTSRRLLYLRFKQMTGKPIHETILDCRLEAAKRKLKQTNAPLSQIAKECGIGSANRLSHLFHERFGLYPCSFRKKSASEPNTNH